MPDGEIDTAAPSRPWHHLAALAALAAFTIAMYASARRCGVVSDGWHLLQIGSLPLREAVATRLGVHFIPGTHLVDAVLWRLIGMRDPLYQLVNLAELGCVAAGVYGLAWMLFRRLGVALLAGLLFAANASFYEIPFWPGVGNFQSAAALIYVAAVVAGWRSASGAPGRPSAARWAWAAVFGLLALAAFFTYEPAFSAIPAGVLAAMAARDLGGRVAFRDRLRLAFPALAAGTVAVGCSLAAKAALAAKGDPAFFLPTSAHDILLRLHFVIKGVLATFLLRGNDIAISNVLALGSRPSFGEPRFLALIVGWSLVLAAAALALLLRGGTAVRFLVAWFVVHLALLSIATVPQSRHLYLGAMSGAVLAAWLLAAAGELVARRLRGLSAPASSAVAAWLPFFALLLLLPGAKADIEQAARQWSAATAATRRVASLVQERVAEHPPLAGVTLVNLPAWLAEDGMLAYWFLNGSNSLVELATGGRVAHDQVRHFHTYDPAPAGRYANGSRPATVSELAARVADPTELTLAYDRGTRTVTRLRPTTWRLPAAYTPASAPFLDWAASPPHALRVAAGQPLRLEVAGGPGELWLSLRILRAPGSNLTIAVDGASHAVPPLTGAAARWNTVTLPLADGHGSHAVDLAVDADAHLAGLWTLHPPAAFDVANSPFLQWWEWGDVFVELDTEVTLPLRDDGCGGGCSLHVEYLDEPGRDLIVAIRGSEHRLVTGGAPGWRSARLPLPGPGTHVLRLVPVGPQPARLRKLAVEPEPKPAAGGPAGAGPAESTVASSPAGD
jgi:hypothetical protein